MIDASTNSKVTVNRPEFKKDDEKQSPQLTPGGVYLNDQEDSSVLTGSLNSLKVGDTQRSHRKTARHAVLPSDQFVSAFVDVVVTLLKSEDRDYLAAATSGEIVTKCKLYLGSLMGDPTARRFVASTMLIVRNNYSELDQQKREKVVEYLHSYAKIHNQPKVLEAELLKLYSAGIRPI